MVKIDRLINIRDVERAAIRRLPRPVYDVVAGGAGNESTIRANEAAFGQWQLRWRTLVDVRERDLSTEVLGERVSLPVMLAPVGYQRMLHREAELASARAAGAIGTVFALNTISSYPIEEVAAVSAGPRWFQLYMPESRTATDELLSRAEASGYRVICLTVDTPMAGLRERDIRNRITQPLKIEPRMVLSALRAPRWSVDFLRGGVGRSLAPSLRLPMSVKDAGRAIARTGRPVSLDDLEWLRNRWDGALVVKGVMRSDDCEKLLDAGVDGVVVSNHGGRQLEGMSSTIDALPDIVDAVDGKAEVFVDGGFRRGTDVLKALALGAKAVLIGRPYLYGLAAGGQRGVERVLEIFREEIDTALGLLGCTSVEQLDRSFVNRLEGSWS